MDELIDNVIYVNFTKEYFDEAIKYINAFGVVEYKRLALEKTDLAESFISVTIKKFRERGVIP